MDAPSLELLFKLLDGTDKIQRFALLLTFRLEKGGLLRIEPCCLYCLLLR